MSDTEIIKNKSSFRATAGRIMMFKETPLILVIVVAVIILTIIKPTFVVPGNIHSILLGSSFELIIAIGMTALFISGGFDLSVGSVAGFSGIMVGIMLSNDFGVVFSIIIGLLAATGVGLLNGLIIAKLKVNALITTLAMQSIVRGVIYVLTRGLGKPNLPDEFNVIARTSIFGIQTPIIITFVLMIIFGTIYAKSGFFRQYYFIGGSEEAARLSGIRVDRLRVGVYTFVGLMSGLSGLLMASRMGGAIPTSGQGMEMNVIAGCVIGGASLAGGEGTMFGTFLGILIMAIVVNAFNILGVNIYWQRLILGVILLVAVLGDTLRKNKMHKA
jgi:ribose transport system permease protein